MFERESASSLDVDLLNVSAVWTDRCFSFEDGEVKMLREQQDVHLAPQMQVNHALVWFLKWQRDDTEDERFSLSWSLMGTSVPSSMKPAAVRPSERKPVPLFVQLFSVHDGLQ